MPIEEIINLLIRLRDHLDGCSHGYPDKLWDDLDDALCSLKNLKGK